MKVSKNILESIIKQVITEHQTPLPTHLHDELSSAYKALAEATQNPSWGRSVTVGLVKIIMKLLNRVTQEGMLSVGEFNAAAANVLSSERVRSFVKKVSDQALEASTSYQESSDQSRSIARQSFHRVMDAAIGSIVATEIAFCILYDMRNIGGVDAALQHEYEADTRYSIQAGRTIQPTPRESVDSVALKEALASADVLPAARYAWEAIMKFVGMTAGPSMENSHFQPVEDLSLWGVENAYQFGFEAEAPF